MQTTAGPRVVFNVQQIAEDMASRGWSKLDLAKRARLSDMTVIRFLRGERQTSKTAKKIARALGHQDARRYIVSAQPAQVVA